ncbi:N-acetylmuramoyl-L-alanine amidase [Hominifimenecus sp. rT4P-3]|uniref:N-acetylmuramoyl-L-alanine amidase n=1 Tax=Hominifimenecus sp. rT4P-3 TaxID=3242979 RepID=UPI003DA50791
MLIENRYRSFSVAETIIIDAGHGGRDPGAVYQGRKESDDTLRLALALGDILKRAGYNVVYTRTSDVYNTPYEKAVIGNNSGGDLFVSIHRNSVEQPNTSTGVETLVYKDTGLPGELGRNINAELAKLGFGNRGVIERPGLVVLRRTEMPAVLIEAGFINNEKDNALFDEKLEEIAGAIADGITETLNENDPPSDIFYRVQAGAFASRSNADRLRDKLISEGFPAFTVLRDGLYKVQVGAFRNLENAIRMEQVLRGKGYSTFISSN